jgi:hypothetical protein
MPSLLDTVVAIGIVIVFIAALVSLILNFFLNINSVSLSSELTTIGFAVANTLLGSKGVPANWELANTTPTLVGLSNDLNRIAITVAETNGSTVSNITVNVSVTFDTNCLNRSWETTLRILDENATERPYALYNKSLCTSRYINTSDIVFNVSLSPSGTANFLLYFSGDREINETAYPSIAFPAAVSNVTTKVYPVETLTSISVSKLRALRGLSYDTVRQIMGLRSDFKIEVAER